MPTDAQSRFVERMGVLGTQDGIPRMAGRLWGWLLICEPPEQTAGQLAEALDASRGSISASARLLTTIGLVHRSTRRGDRREYFSIPPGSIAALMRSEQRRMSPWVALSNEGLELVRDQPPEQRERMQEFHDLYAFFEREMPAITDNFLAARKGAQ
jgi:DNA-binding transcriptional regulator GbsR (MarR family)